MLAHSPNVKAITKIGLRPAVYMMDDHGNLMGAKVTRTEGVTGYMSFAPMPDSHYDIITEYVDADKFYRPQKMA